MVEVGHILSFWLVGPTFYYHISSVPFYRHFSDFDSHTSLFLIVSFFIHLLNIFELSIIVT
uniref:Putative ovule protein n=1 Tax=Solanum chacoense TaxID=4108 RepID=A0A0V0H596_SOLCH